MVVNPRTQQAIEGMFDEVYQETVDFIAGHFGSKETYRVFGKFLLARVEPLLRAGWKEQEAADKTALQERCESQRRELAQLQDVLHRKNVELDALHMVWCDGGCPGGVHRFTTDPITEEVVVAAERNTARLRAWFRHAQHRIGNASASDWHRENAARIEAKIVRAALEGNETP